MTRIDDEHRVVKYRKDPASEECLWDLNEMLAPLEEQLTRGLSAPRRPVIFVVGNPRSGSTLLSQVMAASGAFAYPSNFVARFWRAPLVGARIEKALDIGAREPTGSAFRSEHGVTEGWRGPHEFSYFWERWFTFRQTHKVTPEDLAKVDRESLTREIAAIEMAYGKSVFFKSLVVCSLQIPFLAEVLPTSLFVVCRRQAVYNAQSVLQCRINRLGGTEHWYSLRPKEYPELSKLSVHEQIAGQLHYSLADVRSALRPLSPDRAMDVSYEALCEDPRRELARVIRFVEACGSMLTWTIERIPASFPCANTVKISEEEFSALQAACERVRQTSEAPGSEQSST